MKMITTLVATAALALTVVSGPGAQAEPASRITTGVSAGHDRPAATWRVTGHWVGERTGYGKVTLRIWRADGRLAGSEHTQDVDCTWRLRHVKKLNGAFVFQEKTTDGGCGDFRIRLYKWRGDRLKVSGGWMFEEVLHRP